VSHVTQGLVAFAVTVGIFLLVWLGARAIGYARKGFPGAAVIGWALLFLGFGIPPPPPPQQQIEDADRERGARERSGSGTSPDHPR
jgi:hypothetical protein